MPRLNPEFFSTEACKEIASRQMLSFITLPDAEAKTLSNKRTASGNSLFSLDALPDDAFGEGPALFNWMSHDIYDVDGLLLFREQMLDLGSGNEWCVRVAASDLLRTQVHCVYGGPSMNLHALKEETLAELRKHPELKPSIVKGEDDVRLVSYNYPSMGIPCESRKNPAARFVVKLVDLTIIPIAPYVPPANPESLATIWSPYDIVTRSTIAFFRRLWEWNMSMLPPDVPKSRKALPDAIRRATERAAPDVGTTNPPLGLVSQKADFFCAPASAQMILQQHNIKLCEGLPTCDLQTQMLIAHDMQTVSTIGTTPENQVSGFNNLSARLNLGLKAVPEPLPTFEKARSEIDANLPFKIGDPGHARAVGGYRLEAGDKGWLFIDDPEPTNQGRCCCEPWDANFHGDFMYVRPV